MPITQDLRCVKRADSAASAATGWISNSSFWYPAALIGAHIGGEGRTYELFFFWDGTSPTATQRLRLTTVAGQVRWRVEYRHQGSANGPGRWAFECYGFNSGNLHNFNYVLEANEWYHLVVRGIDATSDPFSWSQYNLTSGYGNVVQIGKVGNRVDGLPSTGSHSWPYGVSTNGGIYDQVATPTGFGPANLAMRPYGGGLGSGGANHRIAFGGSYVDSNGSYSFPWKGGWAEERLWVNTRSELEIGFGRQSFATPQPSLAVYLPWNDTIQDPHLYSTKTPTDYASVLGVSYGGSFVLAPQTDEAWINDVDPNISIAARNPFGFLSHPFQVVGTDHVRSAGPSLQPEVEADGPLLKAESLGTALTPPIVSATYTFDEAVVVQTTASPNISVTGGAELIRSPNDVLASPSVMAEYELNEAFFRSPSTAAQPLISATFNHSIVRSVETSVGPTVAADPAPEKTGEGEASLAPTVSATVTTDFAVAGSTSLQPTIAATDIVNEVFEESVEAVVAPLIFVDYQLNQEISATAFTSAAPSISATITVDWSRSAGASAAPRGGATYDLIIDHEVTATTSIQPSVSAVAGFTQSLSLLLEEGSEIEGLPQLEDDDLSVLDVWNNALVRLGSATITATNDGSNEATKISAAWPQFRTQFLTEHSWNGAKETTSITKYFQPDGVTLVTPPARWNHTYILPSDCLRVLAFNGMAQEPSLGTLWEIESRVNSLNQRRRVMHTNIPAGSTGLGELQYIRDVGSEVDLLSAKTRHAMSLSLAAWVASSFGKSGMRAEIEAEADRAIRAAKSIDGQEGTPSFFSEDTLSAVRDRDRFGNFGSGSGYYGV